jgi:outer membrane receptor protein involved in Fe transport
VRFGAILPYLNDTDIESSNSQYGLYLQDDWDVSNRLQVNLGLRYDYEKTPAYLDYVTPADVVAALNGPDTNQGGDGHPAPAPGQTYAQTLARGGINISDYISTGSNRDAFDSGIQPRLGFSFDLADDQRHVIFGGAGRSYDRNVFEYMARETFKGSFPEYTRYFSAPGRACPPQSNPGNCLAWDPSYLDIDTLTALVAANPQLGREVFMLNNDIKTPYSDQFSVGMRNRIVLGSQDWLTSATVAYIRSEDGIVFTLGNRWPDGQFRQPGTIWGGQPWGNGIPGLGSLIIGNNGIQTRTKQLLLSAEKPYTEESGWGASIAYTGTDAKENRSNVASSDDTYIFDFATASGFGYHTSTGVSKHRLVATGIVDAPWAITVSSKLTLATPRYIDTNNCVDAPSDRFCFPDPGKPDTTLGYKQFDLALQKQFGFLEDFGVRVRVDILNVFNWANPDQRVNDRGGVGTPNREFLKINSYFQPTRTFKLSFSANWR